MLRSFPPDDRSILVGEFLREFRDDCRIRNLNDGTIDLTCRISR